MHQYICGVVFKWSSVDRSSYVRFATEYFLDDHFKFTDSFS